MLKLKTTLIGVCMFLVVTLGLSITLSAQDHKLTKTISNQESGISGFKLGLPSANCKRNLKKCKATVERAAKQAVGSFKNEAGKKVTVGSVSLPDSGWYRECPTKNGDSYFLICLSFGMETHFDVNRFYQELSELGTPVYSALKARGQADGEILRAGGQTFRVKGLKPVTNEAIILELPTQAGSTTMLAVAHTPEKWPIRLSEIVASYSAPAEQHPQTELIATTTNNQQTQVTATTSEQSVLIPINPPKKETPQNSLANNLPSQPQSKKQGFGAKLKSFFGGMFKKKSNETVQT